MYNFNAHTLNGVAVSYSSLPNFALDIIERDERLTLASCRVSTGWISSKNRCQKLSDR